MAHIQTNGLDARSISSIRDFIGYSSKLKFKIANLTGAKIQREIYYQNIVHHINFHSFKYIPFAVSAAANYSLLYVIYRVVREGRPDRIAELGAGQSSLFLDSLRDVETFSALTVEHDPAWNGFVSARVRHETRCHELEDISFRGQIAKGYPSAALDSFDADVLIVDGPIGTARYSRWGAGPIIERMVGREFVVIFDDAERSGEQETISEVLDMLRENKVEFFIKCIFGYSFQFIIMTQKYKHLQFI
ncbi:hypothetical protein [Ancylobacter dichloromethanicus]|uniref:hypothetical protein n=1 Tax=Ancylobacter dichloromethanicus TaxID=518825 RepID=UPI0036096D54